MQRRRERRGYKLQHLSQVVTSTTLKSANTEKHWTQLCTPEKVIGRPRNGIHIRFLNRSWTFGLILKPLMMMPNVYSS